jgi:serine/threonine protein kinase
MAWTLPANVLDACVKDLSRWAQVEELSGLSLLNPAQPERDARSSQWARAYHVRRADGSSACLRFWYSEPHVSIIETYEAMALEDGFAERFGVPRTQLFRRAIVVGGNTIPAVLMDWIEGAALGDTIASRLPNPSYLRRLAEALRRRFAQMNAAAISHGDLRASNIMISEKAPISVSLIDLDSLRWSGGPRMSRAVGGNPAFEALRKEMRVSMLESDYLDQALTYLTLVSVAARPALWRVSTDAYITPDHLRGDSDEILQSLQSGGGKPGRIALAVRQVIDGRRPWSVLRDAIAHEDTGPMAHEDFWGVFFERPGAVPPEAKPSVPEPEVTIVDDAPSQPVEVTHTPALWAGVIAAIVLAAVIWLLWVWFRS